LSHSGGGRGRRPENTNSWSRRGESRCKARSPFKAAIHTHEGWQGDALRSAGIIESGGDRDTLTSMRGGPCPLAEAEEGDGGGKNTSR